MKFAGLRPNGGFPWRPQDSNVRPAASKRYHQRQHQGPKTDLENNRDGAIEKALDFWHRNSGVGKNEF